MTANGKIRLRWPILVRHSITTHGPITVPAPILTSGPITVPAPTSTLVSSSARWSITAEGWIRPAMVVAPSLFFFVRGFFFSSGTLFFFGHFHRGEFRFRRQLVVDARDGLHPP